MQILVDSIENIDLCAREILYIKFNKNNANTLKLYQEDFVEYMTTIDDGKNEKKLNFRNSAMIDGGFMLSATGMDVLN